MSDTPDASIDLDGGRPIGFDGLDNITRDKWAQKLDRETAIYGDHRYAVACVISSMAMSVAFYARRNEAQRMRSLAREALDCRNTLETILSMKNEVLSFLNGIPDGTPARSYSAE